MQRVQCLRKKVLESNNRSPAFWLFTRWMAVDNYLTSVNLFLSCTMGMVLTSQSCHEVYTKLRSTQTSLRQLVIKLLIIRSKSTSVALIFGNGVGPFASWGNIQFSSVTQSCLTLWDPMNCSTTDPPVHHQLLEFTQTHIHQVGDAIQSSRLCQEMALEGNCKANR